MTTKTRTITLTKFYPSYDPQIRILPEAFIQRAATCNVVASSPASSETQAPYDVIWGCRRQLALWRWHAGEVTRCGCTTRAAAAVRKAPPDMSPAVYSRLHATRCWGVTITTESSRKTVQQRVSDSRMHLPGYVGHSVTIFSWMFTLACCLVVGLGLGFGLGLDFVSGW